MELNDKKRRRRPRATEPTFENVFGHWCRFRAISEELQKERHKRSEMDKDGQFLAEK